MKKHLVYGLVDPLTRDLRYIGKSSSGMSRPRSHTAPSSLKSQCHKTNWIKALLSQDMRPDIVVIEELDSASLLYETEAFWISFFRCGGARLTNLSDGGPGPAGYVPSSTHRQKISQKMRGRKFTAEHRAALSRARSCPPPVSAKTREKLRIALLKRLSVPEEREKMTPKVGRRLSEETKNRMAKAKGRPFVDETGRFYLRMSEAGLKLGVSPSHIGEVLKGKRRSIGGHTFTYVEAS